MPLLVRGELAGVLCLESEQRYRFHEEDKASIELLGSYLAIAIQNMQIQEQSGQTGAPESDSRLAGASPDLKPHQVSPGRSVVAAKPRHELVYYTRRSAACRRKSCGDCSRFIRAQAARSLPTAS